MIIKHIVKLEHHPAQEGNAAIIPIGCITEFAGDKIPPGWTEACGQRLSRYAYPEAAGLFRPWPAKKWWHLRRRYRLWKMWHHDGEFQVPDFRGVTQVGSIFP
jgi:hypothetical protein